MRISSSATTTRRGRRGPLAAGVLRAALGLGVLAGAGCSPPPRGRALGADLAAGLPAATITWSRDSGRGVEVAPVLDNGVLVVATTDRRVELIDPASGQRLWRKRLDGSVTGRPDVRDGRMIAATLRPEGSVYAIDLRNRRVLWHVSSEQPVGAAFFEGTALVVGADGRVSGLSPADGRAIWSTSLEASVWSPPVLDAARALFLVPARTGALFGVDARSGEKRWVADLTAPVVAVVATSSGICALSAQGDVHFLDGSNGSLLWRTPLALPLLAPPVVAGNRLVVAAVDGTVLALSCGDGAVLWRRRLGAPLRAAPAVDGDRLLVVAVSGEMWRLALDDGRLLGAMRHPEPVLAAPVAVNGRWVVAGERGTLTSYLWGDAS